MAFSGYFLVIIRGRVKVAQAFTKFNGNKSENETLHYLLRILALERSAKENKGKGIHELLCAFLSCG
jgi:hypothetical protein